MQYCLLVVADMAAGFVVGLTKKRGAPYLLERITFPGGKLEAGESPEQAASREMREETGLCIEPAQWHLVERREIYGDVLYVLAAESDQVFHARTCEDEPVWQLNIVRHLEYCQRNPLLYAPDFEVTLRLALDCLLRQSLSQRQPSTQTTFC